MCDPIAALRPAQFRVERIQCPVAGACAHIYCNLTRAQRNRPQFLNLGCRTNRTLDRIHVAMRLYSHFIGYRNAMIDLEMDFCALLADRSALNPITAMACPYFLRYTTVNHTCPFEERFFGMTAMPLDAGWVAGSLLPTGRYRGDWRFYERGTNVTFLLVRLHFAVT